ncbi:hypothetical protein [Paraburkholderia sp. RL17-337-BIB-A]|uniref:hypothetical protein n=1 Tax=Paraburkholderia sp. RL17-337-BIB-A TaxID=3031636 RepID=UPI0038BDA084
MTIGLMAGLVIGGLGFYYELKASNQAEEDARLKKAAALKSSTEAPAAQTSDIDQVIRQQQEAAASEAAARAASDAAAARRPTVKPMLTDNDFQNEVAETAMTHTRLLKAIVKTQSTRRPSSSRRVLPETRTSKHRLSRLAFRRWTTFGLHVRRRLPEPQTPQTPRRSRSPNRARLPKTAIVHF